MSKSHAARLLYGRLAALQKYGSASPWLYNLEAATRLLWSTSRQSYLASSSSMALNGDKTYQEIMQQICAAVTDYLGVLTILHSLDNEKQNLCCEQQCHPEFETHWYRLFEPLTRPRRPELPLDWAILTATYERDFAMVAHLLENERFRLGRKPKLSASLQHSAGRDCETVFQLLLNAGVDVNGVGHPIYCDHMGWVDGSALGAACAAGCVGIVEICLSPEHNLISSGDIYGDAMIHAAYLDHHENALIIVKWLMSRWSFWTSRERTIEIIFEIACKKGNFDLGRFVYENAPYNLNASMHPESPLCLAIENGHVDMVMYVLSQHRTCLDKFPHAQAEWWRFCELKKAMRRAAEFGQVHIASLIWDEHDSWPMRRLLSVAARFGHTAMIEFLLSKGLDLNLKASTSDPRTIGEHALIEAAKHGHTSTTRFLLGIGIRTPNLEQLWCTEKENSEHAAIPARRAKSPPNLWPGISGH